jgi:heme-degrading monooxygenase HmoA
MIRVVIERWLKKGTERNFNMVMRDMRREAVPQPGYVTGETLRDAEEPLHYAVISTWVSREAWDAWAVSEERTKVREQIRPMLRDAEKVTIYAPA